MPGGWKLTIHDALDDVGRTDADGQAAPDGFGRAGADGLCCTGRCWAERADGPGCSGRRWVAVDRRSTVLWTMLGGLGLTVHASLDAVRRKGLTSPGSLGSVGRTKADGPGCSGRCWA